MEIVLKASGEAWRSSGRPKIGTEPIPEYVYDALRATYNTGEVGVMRIRTPADLEECHELLALMRRAARKLGKRLATQPYKTSAITDRVAYRLVDRTKP